MADVTELNRPRVVVLMLSYNGKDLLDESVGSYLANDYPDFELVVIDNGSTDGTKAFVEKRFPKVYVHRTEENLKYAGGFNFGLQYAFGEAKADLVLITNNDVKADPKIISACVNCMQRYDNAGFVTGKVYYYERPEMLQTAGKLAHPVFWRQGNIGGKEIDKGQFEEEKQLDWCDDIFWMVRRELYEKTGGYDTEFAFQAEDFDWQVRAKEEGYAIYYTPAAKLWHKDSITIGKASPFKVYYDYRNPLIVHLKYRTKEEARPYVKRQFNTGIRFILKSLVKGRFAHASAAWRGTFSAIRWAKRHNKWSWQLLY